MKYETGFYWLTKQGEHACLVRVYEPMDGRGFVIGFGVWDGGGLLPLSDLTADSVLTKIELTEPK